MQTKRYPTMLCASLVLATSFVAASAQKTHVNRPVSAISTDILVHIIRAEDERRWDSSLALLMAEKDARVRKRAALAAGRIGDERAVPVLVDLLRGNDDADVRQMAAFALGEIESAMGAQALIVLLENNQEQPVVRARAIEALGKIDAALPESAKEQKHACDEAILNALRFEADKRSMPDRASILLGLTAALRAKPEGAGPVIKRFLGYSDARILADALNALARLRLKDGNDEARRLLVKHTDPNVRANAARVLGATEDKQAFDALLDRAQHDSDLRVRVSAIRALGSLKDKRAADPLLDRGKLLWTEASKNKVSDVPSELIEILEIATALGRILPLSNSEKVMTWLDRLRDALAPLVPEVEVAYARIAPQFYMIRADLPLSNIDRNGSKILLGRSQTAVAQGLAELAIVKTNQPALDKNINEITTNLVRGAFRCRSLQPPNGPTRVEPGSTVTVGGSCTPLQTFAVPDYLHAYAALKPGDLLDVLQQRLSDDDVIVRATAAELLAEQPPSSANTRVLIEALPRALQDKDLNDAALAILDALAKQKTKEANEAIKTALDSSDHLIRRRAVALLKANSAGDFSNRIGTVQTRNTEADYRRAIARIGKLVTATVETSKGSFVIEFLPEDAPLTVDNFIQLARKGFFNGQTIPRVVPNFVVQAGDPRGDTNGGPGYSIRCEINEVPYDRAAVGMALSGKDTGGSQWFVTHAPQPHLDGGYTVFGRVISGMDVVDRIARGDIIRRVTVSER